MHEQSRFHVVLLAGLVLCACSQPSGENEDEFRAAESTLTKGSGGVSGVDVDYCDDPAFPCVSGESDCDSDAQCEGTLVCGLDNGPQFGFPRAWDVCVPAHCENGVRDADETAVDCGGADCGTDCSFICSQLNPSPAVSACTEDCRCDAGESDCDSDAECAFGLVCGTDNGPQFGHPAGYDTCVAPHCTNGVLDADETAVDCGGADCGPDCSIPPVDCGLQPENGHPSRCSASCPCPPTEGDCDSAAECASGGTCVDDIGASFGFAAGIDVCLASHCDDGVTNGDELGTDCGPSCLPCSVSDSAALVGAGNNDNVSRAAVDSSNNVYVVGRYMVSTNLGGSDLTTPAGSSSTATDVFVAKYNAAGLHQWSRTIGGTFSDGLLSVAIAVSPSGDIAIAGDFNGTVDFGDGPRTTTTSGPGTEDAFILVLDTDGNFRWVRTFGGPERDTVYDIGFDTTGNLLATGQFTGTINVGGSTLVSQGGTDVFVARFSATGSHLASRAFGGPGTLDAAFTLEVAGASTYIGGTYRGAASFGSFSSTSVNNGADAFIVRLSTTSLNPVHARFFGGTNEDRVLSLAADSSLRVTAVGAFGGSVDFGNAVPVASNGGLDGFVLGTNSDLTYRWARTFGGTGNDSANGVAVHISSRNVHITGEIRDAVTFNGSSVSGFGERDSFLATYTADGAPLRFRRDGGTGIDIGRDVAIRNNTLIYTGVINANATVAGASLTALGSFDVFYDIESL